MPIFSVTEVTGYIHDLFEEDFRLQDVWLSGEVSNVSRPPSGHLYFTLKDDGAQIKCVMWKSQARWLDRLPTHGEAVITHGRISVYEPAGAYQLYVDAVQTAGLGALHAQVEALRERLRAEGLFDDERKRPLPAYPQHIGVVTSPQAAAWRDVLTTLARRWPAARVTLAPTLVQGVDAPLQIVAALHQLAALPDIDVILLVRGGGSLEDLWAFNDESVARAVVGCPVPVVCGVGHETDFTIADFAADVRAPTPTAAAELATPDRRELRRQVVDAVDLLNAALEALVLDRRSNLTHVDAHLRRLSPQRKLAEDRRRVEELARRAERTMAHRLALARAEREGQAARLATLDPRATLRRGYAIVSDPTTGRVVSQTQQAKVGQPLNVQVAGGSFDVTVGRQRRLLG